MAILRTMAATVVLAACIPAAAQQPAGAKSAPAKTAAKPSPKPAVRVQTDAQLEADIRARFAKSKIHTNAFQVHVQGGVATIEGKTEVLQHKGTATRLAKNAGAVSVNNKIEVSAAAKKKAADSLELGRRRALVKRGEPRSQENQ
jgi:hypothetical protein